MNKQIEQNGHGSKAQTRDLRPASRNPASKWGSSVLAGETLPEAGSFFWRAPLNLWRLKLLAFMLLVALSGMPASAQDTNYYTPDQYLKMQPKPVFKPGHKLPRLGESGWGFSFAVNVELATNWGYCLWIHGPGYNFNRLLAKTNSDQFKMVQLSKNDPEHFPLMFSVDRFWPYSMPPTNDLNLEPGFYVTNASGMHVDDHTNTWPPGASVQFHPVPSPEASDADWTAAATFQADALKTLLASNASIAIVENEGEYGLGVPGFDQKAWSFDPRCQAAMATNGLSWNRYISNRKSHQMQIVAGAIRAVVPGRQLYVFYNTGNEQHRFYQPGYTNWEDSFAQWGWSSAVMNPTTDLPSFENYYIPGQGTWTNATGTKWNNVTDLLTRQLDAVGYNYSIGATNLNYDWVCGGWSLTNTNAFSDIPHYMGFLKCLYTSGMIGAAAGYFSFPTGKVASIFGENGFTGSFPTNTPPHWLLQLIALSRVHAQFSYFDTFLFNSDLLPGNGVHFMSADQPSYEFTNTAAVPNVRVLARKLRSDDQWLVTAWTADGPDTNVSVNIPVLGQIQVLARASGAVYLATPTNLTLTDKNGVFPTGLSAPPVLLHAVN